MVNHDPKSTSIADFLSALELLKHYDGEYLETYEPIDSHAELSGVYRYAGARGTVTRPALRHAYSVPWTHTF